MGTGQMLLTVMAVVLFGLVVFSMNASIVGTTEQMVYSSVGLNAVSLAESIFERANNLAFDEKCLTTVVSNVSQLTDPSFLGCDSAEIPSLDKTFDDVDDYNGFHKDTVISSVPYHVNVAVYYISYGNWDAPFGGKSFYKRMVVTVTSPFMPGTNAKVEMTQVFSHYSHRIFY